jgi:hypothetical protein
MTTNPQTTDVLPIPAPGTIMWPGMMHVDMRMFDPNAELQTGLDRENALAARLRGTETP